MGTIILAPQVLVTIARRVALSTPGVAGMAHAGRRQRLNLWWSSPRLRPESSLSPRPGFRPEPQGARVQVEDGMVTVDLYIVAQRNVNLYRLGQRLQGEVSRAIQEMVGLPVSEVNVHIQDVAPGSPRASP